MALYDSCSGPEVTAIVPLDGSVGVSPDAVPYMVGDTACGNGTLQATLTADAGTTQTQDLDVIQTGLYKLDGLVLEPDTTYTLGAGQTWVRFQTGEGPVQLLTGSPTVQITGSELVRQQATVSLQVTPAEDPFGAPFTLSREGQVVTAGVDAQSVVDDFSSRNQHEWCYTMTQYLGDGSTLTSDDACITLGHTGCATTGGAPSGTFVLAAAVVAGRRRRATAT